MKSTIKDIPPGAAPYIQGYFAWAYYGISKPPNTHPGHKEPEWLKKWHEGNKEAQER